MIDYLQALTLESDSTIAYPSVLVNHPTSLSWPSLNSRSLPAMAPSHMQVLVLDLRAKQKDWLYRESCTFTFESKREHSCIAYMNCPKRYCHKLSCKWKVTSIG
jgi:hypothetical protein